MGARTAGGCKGVRRGIDRRLVSASWRVSRDGSGGEASGGGRGCRSTSCLPAELEVDDDEGRPVRDVGTRGMAEEGSCLDDSRAGRTKVGESELESDEGTLPRGLLAGQQA